MDSEQVYEAVETARNTGSIKKGTNEVTKAAEKGTAKLIIAATDVSPKEIIMHLSIIAKEKKTPYVEVESKEQLGAAAGLPLGTSAVAITKEGEAKALIKDISKK